MKNIICLVLAIISLSSCQQMLDINADNQFASRVCDTPLYYGDFNNINSVGVIPLWMSRHVTYRETKKIKTPKEIVESGFCDCDGYALLFMNIAYVRFGIKTNLCLVNDRAVVSGGSVNHAIIELDGKYFHAQSGTRYTGKIGYRYTFDQVFKY